MADPQTGRRVYIHQGSFEALARQSDWQARRVCRALACVRLSKIVHHHIAQGLDLGAFRPEVAEIYTEPIRRTRDLFLSSLFGGLGHRPKLPFRPERVLPVWREGEKPIDTCAQDGYVTFASDEESAACMFGDKVPMRQLRARVSLGEEPALTIISGDNLVVIEEDHRASFEETGELDRPGVLAIDRVTLGDTLQMLRTHNTDVHQRAGGFSADESLFVCGLTAAVRQKFEVPSF